VKYRIYIDEVGNPDLNNSDNPNHRFLSLTGVIVALPYVQSTLHPQMEDLKVRYFGAHPDDPPILHRKELLGGKSPFEALRQPDCRARFDAELLKLMADWEYTVLSVCLDKKRQKDTYSVWLYDPYHYCLLVLLERYVLFLERTRCRRDVMAESRGGKEDKRLKESFRRLWRRGTDWVSAERFHASLTSRELKMKPKANNISGLRLADLLAHPSRNEILSDHDLLGRQLAPFGIQIVGILQTKYDQRGGAFYGKKLL